ncbi:MAG: GerW family sporulation protein [Lachnospiraceae bacterium]|nr:GerW family sporulation protein [Lachnospiraceae bacterium]
MDNKMKETIESMLSGVSTIVDTKKVVGEPYQVGNTTIIPFIETTMGLGIGEFKDKDNEAGGMGCKVSPVACLVIQDGFTKLINIKNQDSISKALDMIPDLVDKLLNKNSIPKEAMDHIDSLDDEYIG